MHEQPAIVKSNLKSILVFVKHSPVLVKKRNNSFTPFLSQCNRITSTKVYLLEYSLFYILFTQNISQKERNLRFKTIA